MTTPNPTITKTCSSCGETKPLSAFLELAGQLGARYGNICSACRKSNLDKPKVSKEIEDSTTSTSGLIIDSKAKVQSEVDKREFHKQVEEEYFENREEEEQDKEVTIEKIQHIAKEEKKHRETFIEKRGFLDKPQKPYSAAQAQVFGGEHQAAAERQINLAAPVIDTQITGKEKYKSATFNQFKAWLGGSAPIVRSMDAAIQKNNNPANKNAAEKAKGEKDPVSDYIEKNTGSGPGARRK